MSAAAQDGVDFWDMDRPLDMANIADLEVMCGKNHMEVRITFDRPFNGIIFSKGAVDQYNCIYVKPQTGSISYTFNILYDQCGTKPDMNGKFYENNIVIQYDKDLIEVWDEAKRLRCEWYNDYEKGVTKPPIRVSELEVVELNFRGDNVDCWMEIQLGKGPWASPVTGIVPLGTTLTMVIGINDVQGEFDMRVKSCSASGPNTNSIQLSDQHGCVLRPKMISKFMKIAGADTRASVVTYAFFHAFKFPDSMAVHIRCKVEICRYGCPDHCQKPNSYVAREQEVAASINNPQYRPGPRNEAHVQPQQVKRIDIEEEHRRVPEPQRLISPQAAPSIAPESLPSPAALIQTPPQPHHPQPQPQGQPQIHSPEFVRQHMVSSPADHQAMLAQQGFILPPPTNFGPQQPNPSQNYAPPQQNPPQNYAPRQPNLPPQSTIRHNQSPPRYIPRPPRQEQRPPRHQEPPARPSPKSQEAPPSALSDFLGGIKLPSLPFLPNFGQKRKSDSPLGPRVESNITPVSMGVRPSLGQQQRTAAVPVHRTDKKEQPQVYASSFNSLASRVEPVEKPQNDDDGPFPYGPRGLKFTKRSTADSSETRERRSVAEDPREDLGVTSGYQVISEVDLAFKPNFENGMGVTVFQGKILPEEVVYGVCLPATGFSALFVLVALLTVISVLVSGFICYHRQLQKVAEEGAPAPRPASEPTVRDWGVATLLRMPKH